MTAPFAATWSGDGWDVLPRDRMRADQEMVVGQRYIVEPMEERSAKAHRFYFATVNDLWSNLSDEATARYPTPEALRKWALIKTGFRHERSIVCSSKAEALRIAAFLRSGSQYAVVIVNGATVIEYTAKSQRGRAMLKPEFQASSAAVLALLSEMIGVEVPQPEAATAGRAGQLQDAAA